MQMFKFSILSLLKKNIYIQQLCIITVTATWYVLERVFKVDILECSPRKYVACTF